MGADHVRTMIVRRLLEGRAPWGDLDVSPMSPGVWQRVRLTVYPPGITPGQRRLLRLRHMWPVGGALLALVGLVLLSDTGPVLSLATVLTAYAAGFAVIARLTRLLRSRCRVVTVATEHVGADIRETGDVQLLRTAAGRLLDLESRRRRGLVDLVTYEAEWMDVYFGLPATHGFGRGRISR